MNKIYLSSLNLISRFIKCYYNFGIESSMCLACVIIDRQRMHAILDFCPATLAHQSICIVDLLKKREGNTKKQSKNRYYQLHIALQHTAGV